MATPRERLTTATAEYAEILHSKRSPHWKKLLSVQAPYKWNIRRLRLGRIIDLGCGYGRNLEHLEGNGVGIDHNEDLVRFCREKGLAAYLPEQFFAVAVEGSPDFDTILLSHVAEHLEYDACIDLINHFKKYVKQGARLVVITPQKAGYNSDATHVTFYDSELHRGLYECCGAKIDRHFSFPFPFWAGRLFTYNETITIGRFN